MHTNGKQNLLQVFDSSSLDLGIVNCPNELEMHV